MPILLTASNIQSQEMIDIISRLATNQRHAAVVTTASVEYKEKNRNAIAAHTALQAAGFRQVSYFGLDQDPSHDLCLFDLVYLSGGNPHYLLKRIRESKADEVLRHLFERRTPIVGTSAGALVLGPSKVRRTNRWESYLLKV